MATTADKLNPLFLEKDQFQIFKSRQQRTKEHKEPVLPTLPDLNVMIFTENSKQSVHILLFLPKKLVTL